MKKNLLLLLFLLSACTVLAQNKSLKQQAIDAFKDEHFPKAIELLKKAQIATPNDPEIYYLLGFYTHYNAYDSRPLAGYNDKYSEKVFAYLEKALQLKPDYGDAKYFYGAECSAIAFTAMQRYQADNMRKAYKQAYKIGAYPAWLLEFGRNFLNQCEPNAILFSGGNPDFDVCRYLQLYEKFRTDITIIPIGYIDRPWYVAFMKKGLQGAFKSAPISLSDEQIEDIRPFKWDTTTINISISYELKKKYNLTSDATMDWVLKPDYLSDRVKQENREKKRTYLSPQRAILLNIVETNRWQRPIYFSHGVMRDYMGGLEEYIQDCGLVSKLLPIKTANTVNNMDIATMEKLILNPLNFRDYSSIVNDNIPRISWMTTFYHSAAYSLTKYYSGKKDKTKIDKIIQIYDKYLRTGMFSEDEEYFGNEINKMRSL